MLHPATANPRTCHCDVYSYSSFYECIPFIFSKYCQLLKAKVITASVTLAGINCRKVERGNSRPSVCLLLRLLPSYNADKSKNCHRI